MSEACVVTVLIGPVKPDVANGLGAALADDARLGAFESEILAAIHRAALGAATLVHANGGGAPRRNSDPARDLTPREMQVFKLVREDKSNREIADRLTISVETVHTHLTKIFRKLDVHSRHQLMEIRLPNGKYASE